MGVKLESTVVVEDGVLVGSTMVVRVGVVEITAGLVLVLEVDGV